MNKKLIALLGGIVLLTIILISVIFFSFNKSRFFLFGSASMTYSQLTQDIKKEKGDDSLLEIEESPNDMFTVLPKRIEFLDEQMDVYEFTTAEEAKAQANRVSADGTNISDYGQMFWENPHFYLKDRVILFYDGNSSEVLQTLEKIMGKSIAGI